MTLDSLDRLPSDAYRDAFNDEATGQQFRAKVESLENAGRPSRGASSTPVVEQAPAQAPTGFDPSFDESPEAAVAAAKARLAPAPKATEQPAQPAAQPAGPVAKDFSTLPELVHEYQPTIDGKPVGGKQRFKYKTVDDPADPNNLITQLQKAHSHASARIRELSRSRKLEEIVDAGVKQTSVPRPTDAVPATPEEMAAELRAVRQSNYELAIRVAVNTWLERCPEYARYKSKENNESVILAVARAGADETNPDSYVKAWETMKDVLTPVVEEAAPAPAPVPAPVAETKAVASTAAAPVRAEQPAMIATGLSNADVFNHELPAVVRPAANQGWTAAKIEALPTEQYKRLVCDPAMARLFDRVLQEHEDRKAEARRGRR